MQIVSRPNCLCWWFCRSLNRVNVSKIFKHQEQFIKIAAKLILTYLFFLLKSIFWTPVSSTEQREYSYLANRFIPPTSFVWSHTDFIRRYNKSRTKELTFIRLQNVYGKIPFLLWCEQPKSPQNRVCLKPGIRNRVEKTHAEYDSEVLIQFSDKGLGNWVDQVPDLGSLKLENWPETCFT